MDDVLIDNGLFGNKKIRPDEIGAVLESRLAPLSAAGQLYPKLFELLFAPYDHDETASIVIDIYEWALTGEPFMRALFPLIADVERLGSYVSETERHGLATALRLRGHFLSHLFSPPPDQPPGFGENSGGDPALDDLPLGMKRTYSKSTDRTVFTRLLYERDPRVIANILDNPATTEQEVVRIASNRFAPAAIPTVIYRHRKFFGSHTVKRTLFYNRATPLNLRIGVLVFLTAGELAEGARTTRDDALRIELMRILKKHKGYRGRIEVSEIEP